LIASLGLFIVRLEISNSGEVIDSQLVFFKVFISHTSSQDGFNKHVCVIKVQSSIDNFSCVFNFEFGLLIFAVAEGNVIENTGF
jgi:hypothetical protein